VTVTLPTVPPEMVALVVTAFIAGACAPVYYAMERFRGFGRAMMSKLPYSPPPGTDTETALAEATDADTSEGDS
jgi:hypothetical protein